VKSNKFRHILVGILLLLGTFFVYKYVYPSPRNWYNHYLYLANSFISLRVDIPNLPSFFQDKIITNGKTLIPFPPVPAFILIPFIETSKMIKIFKNITQQQVSIIFGSINTLLVYFLLKKYTNTKNSVLLSIFFSFGTVAFWAAVIGTTWYFAHTVAITFLILSLISHKNEKYFLSGLFFALAALCRYPILVGGVYFLLELYGKPKNLAAFLSGAFIFIPIQLVYNYLRFGSVFDMGYYEVYKQYISSSFPYTIRQLLNPGASYFGYIDIRNIPLHLFTFFVFPPIITHNLTINPSPYGMGILFTTPLLLISLLPNLKTKLERNLFFGGLFIAFADFLHYTQGWVQFGYRFLLDFLLFFLIILAVRFKLKKRYILLLIISILVNFWGVKTGINLGW
jgi:hypothetical protein